MTHFDATSPQLKVVDQMFEAYRSDLNKASSVYSKNFTYKALPKADELPLHSREEHIEALGPLLATLAKVEHIIHEVVEVPGKVVAHWTGVCTPHEGPAFEYESLSIITLVEEDGELKILEFKDFADLEKRNNFYKALAKEKEVA